MKDRHAAYIVVLEEDVPEDDARGIITALENIRFVSSVTPVVTSYEQTIARRRRDREWEKALLALVQQGPDADGMKAG